MKVAIKFDHYFVAEAHKVPALLEALSEGAFFQRDGWSSDSPLKPVESKPEIIFIEDSQLQEKEAPLIALQEQLRQSESRWLSYYQQAEVLKKEKQELQDKLNAINATASGSTNNDQI